MTGERDRCVLEGSEGVRLENERYWRTAEDNTSASRPRKRSANGGERDESMRSRLLTLNEISEKGRDLWPRDIRPGRRPVLGLWFSEAVCDIDDERGDSFEQDDDHGYLGEDAGTRKAADFGVCKDGEVVLGRSVGPLGGRPKALELLMTVRSPDNLGNEPGELPDRHMLGEAVVVDPVGAVFREVQELGIA